MIPVRVATVRVVERPDRLPYLFCPCFGSESRDFALDASRTTLVWPIKLCELALNRPTSANRLAL